MIFLISAGLLKSEWVLLQFNIEKICKNIEKSHLMWILLLNQIHNLCQNFKSLLCL